MEKHTRHLSNEAVEHTKHCKDKHIAIVLKHYSGYANTAPGAPAQATAYFGSVILLIPADLATKGVIDFGRGGNSAWVYINALHRVDPTFYAHTGTFRMTRADEKVIEGDLNLTLKAKWYDGTVETGRLTGEVKAKPATGG